MLILRRFEFSSYIDCFYQSATDNCSIVFIKPENLTKTELIEKFKDLSSSKSLKDLKDIKNDGGDKIRIKDLFKSYYSRLSAFISKYKNLITKITLLTIFIKYIKKFKLLRLIFRIINYILLSTFGIFISDIYGIKEIITEIEHNWMKYVNFIHETKIYKSLIKIFHVIMDEDKSEINEIKDEKVSKMVENKSEVIKNKSNSNIVNSEIPSSGRESETEKIVHDKTSERNKWENWFELKNMFLIGISIISLGLIYIYWDSIYELFKKTDLTGDGSGSDTTETPIFITHEEEYKKYFKELDENRELYDLDVIRSQNKGKVIDYSDVEKTKWEDSPTTPKASPSKLSSLPETDRIMIPFSKK